MTTKEFQTIDNLYALVTKLTEANAAFRATIEEKLAKTQKQVNATYLPVNLEQEVLRTAQQSISESIKAVLTGYNSPMTKFVTEVVNENGAFLKTLVADSFNKVIRTEDFKKAIVSEFSHKIAKNMVSGADSMFSKTMNDLKQDHVFRSKMILAVEGIVKEQLENK